MTTDTIPDQTAEAWWRGAFRRIRALRLPWISVTIVFVLLLCAAFSPLLAPHDPTKIDILDGKMAPFEDSNHLLGTDVLGRDMLSRLIYGARTTVFISLVALGTGALVGTVVGLVAGYREGWFDAITMRAADAALGFPTILVAMVIVVIMGAGIESISRQNRWGVHASHNMASRFPEYRKYVDDHHKPSGWTGDPTGSILEFSRLGLAGGGACLGDHGFGRKGSHPGSLVAISIPRHCHHSSGSGIQLFWRLDARRFRPQIEKAVAHAT
jgi:hypothetical protein